MVAIIGLSFLTVTFVKDYLENQTIQNLTRHLIYIDHLNPEQLDNKALNRFLNKVQKLEGVEFRLSIISPNGNVTYDSFQDIRQMDNHIDRPEIKMAIAEGLGSSIRFSKTIQKN